MIQPQEMLKRVQKVEGSVTRLRENQCILRLVNKQGGRFGPNSGERVESRGEMGRRACRFGSERDGGEQREISLSVEEERRGERGEEEKLREGGDQQGCTYT